MNKKTSSMLLLILVITVTFLPSGAIAQEEIVILHTNDLHGASLAKLATIVEELRSVHPYLLLVDGGDLFSGTPVSNLFKGEAEQAAVLALGYDALAIGNHDFDFGQQVLQDSLEAKVPWLAANIYQEDGSTFATPFVIKEFGGTRVLLVGLSSPKTPQMTFNYNVDGLDFADPVATLQQVLKEQGGNFDVCLVLSHLGYGEDLLLAQRVSGITAIIGGHSHTTLRSPVRIKNTLITQTGSSASYLGKVTIKLQPDYPATGELISIDKTTPPHPAIKAIDDHYEAILAVEMDQVLGYTTRGYVKNGLGILLAGALHQFSGADAALYNGGGVRSGLSAGAVTKKDVFAVEPFGNQAVVVTLSGLAFSELLKIKASRSGDFYEGPKLIDLNRNYTVATSDFLTSEGSSYPMLTTGQITYLGIPVREILEEYLQKYILEQSKKGAQ